MTVIAPAGEHDLLVVFEIATTDDDIEVRLPRRWARRVDDPRFRWSEVAGTYDAAIVDAAGVDLLRAWSAPAWFAARPDGWLPVGPPHEPWTDIEQWGTSTAIDVGRDVYLFNFAGEFMDIATATDVVQDASTGARFLGIEGTTSWSVTSRDAYAAAWEAGIAEARRLAPHSV